MTAISPFNYFYFIAFFFLISCGGSGDPEIIDDPDSILTPASSSAFSKFTLLNIADSSKPVLSYELWMLQDGVGLKKISNLSFDKPPLSINSKVYFLNSDNIYHIEDVTAASPLTTCITCGMTISKLSNLTYLKQKLYF